MSKHNQAVQDIKRFAAMARGIIALGEELEKIGSIENAAAEAEARFVKVSDKAKRAEEVKQAAQAEIDKIKNAVAVEVKKVHEAQAAQAEANKRKQELEADQKSLKEAVAALRTERDRLQAGAVRLRDMIAQLHGQAEAEEDRLAQAKKLRAELQRLG